MGTNCCSTLRTKVDDWKNTLFGRPERQNPEGKGPNGQVSDTPQKTNVLPENNPNQVAKLDEGKNSISKETFNPSPAVVIKPVVQETPTNPSDPRSLDVNLTGSVVHNPFAVAPGSIEKDEARRERIKQEKAAQKPEVEAIKARTDVKLDQLGDKYKTPQNNPLTNNQEEKAKLEQAAEEKRKALGNQVEPAKQAPAQVVSPQKQTIPSIVRKFNDVFPGDSNKDETQYSSHGIVMEDPKWSEFFGKIQGEFYDQDFPAKTSSLKGAGVAGDEKDKKKLIEFESYEFKRLSYVLKDFDVIRDGISPNDIYQGGLGNCYFMSALASIAENPDRIMRNIVQTTRNEKGAYCILLNVTGAWVPVPLDDIFPVRKDGVLAFSYTKTNEIWAMLFEKAYAKVYGGYMNIGSGGMCSNALSDITGAPCNHINLSTPEELKTAWENASSGDRLGFIMNASSKGQGETKNANGIIAGHAYTLQSVYELNGEKLLKLRNPWGKGEWTGAWGDNSNKWTNELKLQVGWTAADDGTFYIGWNDFLANFDGISICHYKYDYIYSYLKDTNSDEEVTVFQFTVHKEGEYYLGMSQPDKNMFKHDKNYQYGYMSCLVGMKDEKGQMKYVEGFGEATRDPWLKTTLKAGSYFAIVYTNWNSANENLTFWAYGARNISIRKVEKKENLEKATEYMTSILIDKALASKDKWTAMSNPKLSQVRYKFEHTSDGYGYYIFDNPTPNVKIIATLKKTSTGCDYVYPPNSTGSEVVVEVGPNTQKIVIYRISAVPNSVSFQVGFKITMTS
jgi:hypothetical protein